ncbi:MAG: helix-hairpin-helix domain-containing protein, partial [Acidimicrobiales bacterium]
GRIIAALGIRGTGRSMSRRLASHFSSMAALRAATVEELAGVEGIGSVKAPAIAAELVVLAPIITRLEALGVDLGHDDGSAGQTGPALEGGDRPLAGLTICVTGAMTGPLASLSRNEVNELIERLGGKAASSVSAKTSLLLTADGDSGTAKAKKAAELGVGVVDPETFAARYCGLEVLR